MLGHGFTEDDPKGIQAGMLPTYALTFICWFVMATVLAVVARHIGEGVGELSLVGFHLWLGFSATVGLNNNRFSGKPLRLWLIDAGYQLGSITLMAAAQDKEPILIRQARTAGSRQDAQLRAGLSHPCTRLR